MSKVKAAVRNFKDGYACSQAVFCAYAKEVGMDNETALKISTGFAGGMRKGEVCGAVTGALMAIGLKYGNKKCDKLSERQKVYEVVNRLHAEFLKKHKSLRCKELLGADPSTPEGRKMIEEKNLHELICAGLVQDTAEILEGILREVQTC